MKLTNVLKFLSFSTLFVSALSEACSPYYNKSASNKASASKLITAFQGVFSQADKKNSRIEINNEGVTMITVDTTMNAISIPCGNGSNKNYVHLQNFRKERISNVLYQKATNNCTNLFQTYLSSSENLQFYIYYDSKKSPLPNCSLSFEPSDSAAL